MQGKTAFWVGVLIILDFIPVIQNKNPCSLPLKKMLKSWIIFDTTDLIQSDLITCTKKLRDFSVIFCRWDTFPNYLNSMSAH